ncbi:MAG: rod shape-determining protein [Erysipelotrichaceae bacterium]|nr:rod shape-determining protein [Erysipelotrichaceae bacterium]MCI9312655.1 rod shape-determining protein [Erysipelotrichaceae bacterium]
MKKIGIDLGTTNLLICVDKEGVIVNEPSVITIDTASKKCIAAGNEAKAMVGKTPKNMRTIYPLKDGVVADYEATDMMLAHFFKKCALKKMFTRNEILICCPTNITSVERNAIRDCAYHAGAKKVYIEEEPKVAAVGAGLDIGQPIASFVLDMGGGTTDIAVISLGDIVCSASIKVAGNRLNKNIIDYMRLEKKLAIGEMSAEAIKIEIGCALRKEQDDKTMKVNGRDMTSGLPTAIEITSNEIAQCIEGSLQEIVKACKTVLDVAPPELAADIMTRGLILTGGGALLHDFDELLKQELKIPVYVAEQPLNCVVDGCMKMLERL